MCYKLIFTVPTNSRPTTHHVPADDEGDKLPDGDVAVDVGRPRRPGHADAQLGVAEP